MASLHGIGVSPGTAHGPALRIAATTITPPTDERQPEGPDGTRSRVAAALEDVAVSLEERAAKAPSHAQGVLQATAMIARDPGLDEAVGLNAASGQGPVTALHNAIEQYCVVLADVGGYMAERVADLRDVFQRAAARMLGVPEPGVPDLTEPVILVARDLAPADTAALDPSLVLGIVTEIGGPTSHTAILAAQLGIPAVVQAAGALASSASTLGIDGGSGIVVLDPDEQTCVDLDRKQAQRLAIQESTSGPGRTRDGHPVQILANIGTLDDALKAATMDVEGVGLFRTEFLFLDREDAPDLDEQTDTYRAVFSAFAGRKVVVRTLDAGADKPLVFADLGPEENPALGVRGLRLQARRLDLLDTQLQALARAQAMAGDTDVWVMAPMIATEQEASWFVARARAAGLGTVGTMIEVPAAALRARRVLRACDFASLGTNDLSQYTFAADRMDGRLAELLSGWQPGLWELIGATVRGAMGANAPVGICGEVAGDPLLACVAAGAGVGSLSMATGKVGPVKAALALHTLSQCQSMFAAVLEADGPADARANALALANPDIEALI